LERVGCVLTGTELMTMTAEMTDDIAMSISYLI
jgi:hypothetical protein